MSTIVYPSYKTTYAFIGLTSVAELATKIDALRVVHNLDERASLHVEINGVFTERRTNDLVFATWDYMTVVDEHITSRMQYLTVKTSDPVKSGTYTVKPTSADAETFDARVTVNANA